MPADARTHRWDEESPGARLWRQFRREQDRHSDFYRAQVKAFLPAFMGDRRSPPLGERWVALAGLSFHGDYARDIAVLSDLGPSAHPGNGVILPRGSTLRLVDTFLEIWSTLYDSGFFYVFVVEDGTLAGTTVAVDDYMLYTYTTPRQALATALLVPVGDPTIGDADAIRTRYERLVAILDAQAVSHRADWTEYHRLYPQVFGGPVEPPYRFADAPVSLATDLATLGLPPAHRV